MIDIEVSKYDTFILQFAHVKTFDQMVTLRSYFEHKKHGDRRFQWRNNDALHFCEI